MNRYLTSAVLVNRDFLTDEKSHFTSENCQMQFIKFLFLIIGKSELPFSDMRVHRKSKRRPGSSDRCINIIRAFLIKLSKVVT